MGVTSSNSIQKYKIFEARADLNREKDLNLIKLNDKSLKAILGVTVKSMTESEMDGILNVAYTLTIKMLEDKHGELSLNINKEGDCIPRYRNRRYNQNGFIEGYTGTQELISCSAHMNSSVKCSSDLDFCPFIVSTYDLSIKLNSLDEDSEKHKRKTVFVSRYLDDFIQFQADSIGKGSSKSDFISVFGISKVKKGASKDLPKNGKTRSDGLWIDLDLENYETDELIFRFTTRRKQITNVIRIVIPCILVPLILGETSRLGSLDTNYLLAALLILLFAFPYTGEYGFGTFIWFAFSVILCGACYAVNIPEFGLAIEVASVVLGALLFGWMYNLQSKRVQSNNEGGQLIANLVKDRPDEWRKLKLLEKLCLV